jgi:hypothetical protein
MQRLYCNWKLCALERAWDRERGPETSQCQLLVGGGGVPGRGVVVEGVKGGK